MTALWRHRDFGRFWLAQTISGVGSQISFIALPLAAALMLNASSAQMGILAAAGTLPYLLLGLPAGVWIDRRRRRPILIGADVARAFLLLTVPVAAVFDALRIEHLYAVALLGGIGTLFYDVAEEAFLPSLIGRDRLVEGNSKLAAADALVNISGPGIGGGLVQALTAPFAILADAVSFIASALLIHSVRADEPPPETATEHPDLRAEMREGLWFLLGHPLLRPMIFTSGWLQLFGGMSDALRALFITRVLGLPPAVFGFMYAIGSASGLVAATFSERLVRRAGLGRVVVVASFAIGVGWLTVSLARGTPAEAFGLIAAGMVVAGMGNTLTNVASASLKQAVTPDRLLGRVNASGLFVGWGALPIGSLSGGFLGQVLGVQAAMILSGVGLALGFVWVFFSPLRKGSAIELMGGESGLP